MSQQEPAEPDPLTSPASSTPSLIDPRIARRVIVVAVVLAVGALLLFNTLSGRKGPTPAELADDPLLQQGYDVYMARCVSCHGEKGKGDGPIAKGLTGGPPPRDLTAGQWKHGDRPEQVVEVISAGLPGTNMSGYGKYRILSADEIRAVAAYVYRLAGREVPRELRQADAGTPDPVK
ncbi:MAG: c-type cytochrome [Isosphaeraceae bacterium]